MQVPDYISSLLALLAFTWFYGVAPEYYRPMLLVPPPIWQVRACSVPLSTAAPRALAAAAEAPRLTFESAPRQVGLASWNAFWTYITTQVFMRMSLAAFGLVDFEVRRSAFATMRRCYNVPTEPFNHLADDSPFDDVGRGMAGAPAVRGRHPA